MGVSRRSRPLFKFIRTFNSDLFGNLVSATSRLKRTELLDFSSLGLGAEFWRLVVRFKRDRKNFLWRKKAISHCYRRQLRKQYGLRRCFVRAMAFSRKRITLGRLPVLMGTNVNIKKKKSFIYDNFLGGKVGHARRRLVDSSFGSSNVLGVARFVIRLLGFCVNETRLIVWLVHKFSGLLFGMLRVLSSVWRSFLASLIFKAALPSGGRLLLKHRSLSVRRLFLSKELRFAKHGEGGAVMAKSLVKLNSATTNVNFALQKKSHLSLGKPSGVSEESEVRLFGLRQKMRRFWGNLTMRQLWCYRKRASSKLRGLWERYALALFECRLDVFLVRSGFFRTVNEARYFVKMGLVLVNGTVLTCYRYAVGEGDVLYVWPAVLRKFQLMYLRELWVELLEEGGGTRFRVVPSYLEWSFRRLATCFVVGQFTAIALPQLIKFNTVYSVNCGRFQF